jgi:hypothetical protein
MVQMLRELLAVLVALVVAVLVLVAVLELAAQEYFTFSTKDNKQ